MPLTVWQRKERLPFGAQKEVATEEGCDPAVVSMVVNDKAGNYDPKRVRRIQVRLARKMGCRVDEAFGPPEGASRQMVGLES